MHASAQAAPRACKNVVCAACEIATQIVSEAVAMIQRAVGLRKARGMRHRARSQVLATVAGLRILAPDPDTHGTHTHT